MLLYYDRRFETIAFGIKALKEALVREKIFFVEKFLSSFTGNSDGKAIIVSFEAQKVRKIPEGIEAGGFEIFVDKNAIYVTGKDHSGAMTGLLDLAETIQLFGIEAVTSKMENPFMKMRGIKYNLPFEPYDNGDPFEKNIKTCLDKAYWEKFIDFLAMSRYNCLSLWSEHPYHLMFRLEKYPQTCPYSDVELEKFMDLFRFIFRHARNRGIDVYIITWNIRLTPFVAKGLSLPEAVGDMEDRYNAIYDKFNHIPRNIEEFDAVRQHSEVVKDYIKECIKTLVTTYRDLKGIGTSCSEEMVGRAPIRQQWVAETYLEAIKESGRNIPFIHRTNASNGKITKELFIDKYPYEEKYISWKYSNAHMYSHPEPQFEKLWGAWDGMELDNVKVIYTVRNDDIHTLRWGNSEYISAYVKGMNKPYVQGYYWGADGYIWGDDFQHVDHKHKTWKYDFERHWYQFELLGRMGYNPDTPEVVWISKFKERYGEAWGVDIYYALKAASRIIPAVNRLFWINYDFESHPESLMTVFGFKTVLDVLEGKAMPGSGTLSIREFVEKADKGEDCEGETPEDIIKIISGSVDALRTLVSTLLDKIPCEYQDSDLGCTLEDLKAWAELGEYYFYKISAALKLAWFEATGDEKRRFEAVALLQKGLLAWEKLSAIWASHYLPYRMVRSKYMFGWSYYIDEVRKEIELARYYLP